MVVNGEMSDQCLPSHQRMVANGMTFSWLIVFFSVFLWSAYDPHDRFTWFLEVFPAIAALGVLSTTRKRFPLTSLSYVLILLHCLILFVGGKYTYAEVPLFDWIRDALHHTRNNYDKVGHFAQGFVPAIIARELFLRLKVVSAQNSGWLFFLVSSVCLAISAFYEFIEWWTSVLTGSAGDAFLGTQGYVWDTQSDMFLALVGSVLAQLMLRKIHDRQILQIERK